MGLLEIDELRQLINGLSAIVGARPGQANGSAVKVGPMPLDRKTVLRYAELADQRSAGKGDTDSTNKSFFDKVKYVFSGG